jgi:hypothetical protein
MKVRRLQRKNDEGQWYDDAYAVEESSGQVVFHYNLTWEKIGSYYNGKLKRSGVSLEEIETIIQPTKGLRWLPIEVVEEEAKSFLERLDEACAIPKPRPISIRKVLTA